jgi:hypothetical protein
MNCGTNAALPVRYSRLPGRLYLTTPRRRAGPARADHPVSPAGTTRVLKNGTCGDVARPPVEWLLKHASGACP